MLILLQVDGVTRCLARLLAHLREQGHEAVVLGPQSGMVRNGRSWSLDACIANKSSDSL
jgi:hypothetical protein